MELFQKIKYYYNYYFNPKWVLIWYTRGTWGMENSHGYKTNYYCRYYIYYSKFRKEYKLVTSGYDPKNNHKYEIACNKLIEVNKRGICT